MLLNMLNSGGCWFTCALLSHRINTPSTWSCRSLVYVLFAARLLLRISPYPTAASYYWASVITTLRFWFPPPRQTMNKTVDNRPSTAPRNSLVLNGVGLVGGNPIFSTIPTSPQCTLGVCFFVDIYPCLRLVFQQRDLNQSIWSHVN
jgi:hypothetical protein